MRTRACFIALLFASLATSSALAAPSRSDQRLVAQVAARIFAEAEPVPGWAWPPLVVISDVDDVNAFATTYPIQPGATPAITDMGELTWVTVPKLAPAEGEDAVGVDDVTSPADAATAPDAAAAAALGTQLSIVADDAAAPPAGHEVVVAEDGTVTQPVIILYQGFLNRVVEGNPDRLASVFGHETSHILLRHVEAAPPNTPLVAHMISRDQESAADMLGIKLGLTAGYAYNGLMAGFLKMRDQRNHNSFEGLNVTHPSWTDRVAMVDERQSELWRSISAFENGVYFLTIEHYDLAAQCFDQVTKECPQCYEAWANLGYAYLMRYCDQLTDVDLRELAVGQIIVGGFYRRPESLEPDARGFDPDLWWKAVGSFRQALMLKPDLVLAKANLATAYLVGPPDLRDIGKAEELLAQVIAALESDAVENLHPHVYATLLVNAGVVEMSTGDSAGAEGLFARAEEMFASGDDSETLTDQQRSANAAASSAVASALQFNRGRMLAAATDPAQRQSAIEQLEAYLAKTSPASSWWQLAYDQYAKLCRDAGVDAKVEDQLRVAANTQYRLVTGVVLPDGATLTLNDPLAQLEAALGKGREQNIVKGRNVRRLQYPKLGLDLLAAEQLVAIRLRGPKAPPVVIRASGAGEVTHEIRPGMTLAQLEEALGGDAAHWDERYGATPQIIYRFYSRLGFGVRLAGDKIVEIIVAQIPIEAKRTN